MLTRTKVACHCGHSHRGFDHLFGDLVYHPVRLLRAFVLLLLLSLSQMLRELLRLLRSAERSAQIPG